LNFTFDGLAEARQSLLRIDEWRQRLADLAHDATPDPEYEPAKSDAFFAALDDNLNISAALAELFDQIRATNKQMDQGVLKPAQAAALLKWWDGLNNVLQLQKSEEPIPAKVQELLAKRAAARTNKLWSESDAIRTEIEQLGWTVKDTKEGQKVTPVKVQ
jgi:cysteinyl-tRNA synthetase